MPESPITQAQYEDLVERFGAAGDDPDLGFGSRKWKRYFVAVVTAKKLLREEKVPSWDLEELYKAMAEETMHA